MSTPGIPVRSECPSHRVLGVNVHALNLPNAVDTVFRLLENKKPGYVCVTGVHGVIESQFDESFRDILNRATLCTPDGMPTVWLGRMKGFKQMGRVYGPDLMAAVCEASRDRPVTHFLYGGAPGVAELLRQQLEQRFPGIRIIGTYTPPFRPLTEAEFVDLQEQFRRLRPDITWVGLSTPKQEKFMAEVVGKLDTTLMFGVGAAFDFLSGRVRQAPRWVQRSGFEWLYRVCQEPRRLWKRYLVNNSLFLFWMATREFPALLLQKLRRLRDGLDRAGSDGDIRATGMRRASIPPLRIAFVGSRGVPARYSGFETVVEELGSRLAERGHDVTVYNRLPHYEELRSTCKGMRLRWFPAIPTKNLDTFSHTALCMFDAVWHGYDILYVCGVGNTPRFSWFKRLLARRIVVNVDGADFKRKKWGAFARWWLRTSEEVATRVADAVIADNQSVVRHYTRNYGYTPVHIGYGAPLRTVPVRRGILEQWNLEPGRYILHVSRLTPENETDLLLRAHARMPNRPKLVVVGSSGYETGYERYLHSLVRDQVLFTGGIFGDGYVELSQHAAFFVMPATIEATRLVLLDQMGMGKAILFHDCPASREVLGDAGEPFGVQGPDGRETLDDFSDKMDRLFADPGRCAILGQRAFDRARSVHSWERVVDRYEELLGKILDQDGKRP